METESAVILLAALAQTSRLRVFRLLIEAGPQGMAAGEISTATDIPPSSLSFHLKALSHAGLLTARNAGRSIIYSANFARMNALLAYLTENCCGGNPCTSGCVPACSDNEETMSHHE